jgi:hypothetical protein
VEEDLRHVVLGGTEISFHEVEALVVLCAALESLDVLWFDEGLGGGQLRLQRPESSF